VLPNGDIIGAFGSQSHYVPNSLGAEVVEVNPKGEVVRTYTFPYGWGIYRVTEIGLQTITDYDGSWRSEDFNINLSAINDIGGLADTHYRINNGPTKTVSIDGQPHITTEGANNTLEYWSVDRNGIEESPHEILTGIRLDKSPPTLSITSPLNGSQIGSSTVTVSWTGSDETSGISRYEVRVDRGSWTNVGTDTTRVFSGLADGTHSISVMVLDRAGNERTLSVNFTVSTGLIRRTDYALVLTLALAVALGAVTYLLRSRKHRKS
jgi:hypothetical protein